jgi:hypothetical protein
MTTPSAIEIASEFKYIKWRNSHSQVFVSQALEQLNTLPTCYQDIFRNSLAFSLRLMDRYDNSVSGDKRLPHSIEAELKASSPTGSYKSKVHCTQTAMRAAEMSKVREKRAKNLSKWALKQEKWVADVQKGKKGFSRHLYDTAHKSDVVEELKGINWIAGSNLPLVNPIVVTPKRNINGEARAEIDFEQLDLQTQKLLKDDPSGLSRIDDSYKLAVSSCSDALARFTALDYVFTCIGELNPQDLDINIRLRAERFNLHVVDCKLCFQFCKYGVLLNLQGKWNRLIAYLHVCVIGDEQITDLEKVFGHHGEPLTRVDHSALSDMALSVEE